MLVMNGLVFIFFSIAFHFVARFDGGVKTLTQLAANTEFERKPCAFVCSSVAGYGPGCYVLFKSILISRYSLEINSKLRQKNTSYIRARSSQYHIHFEDEMIQRDDILSRTIEPEFVLLAYPREMTSDQDLLIINQIKSLSSRVRVLEVNPIPGALAHYRESFIKLYIWSLVEYDRVVFFDADNLVKDDLNHLCMRPDLTATHDVVGALLYPHVFNTALLVIQPNITRFKNLINFASISKKNLWGDMDLINHFYRDNGLKVYEYLGFQYSALTYHLTVPLMPFLDGFQNAKIIHFSGKKPWKKTTAELSHNQDLDKKMGFLESIWFCVYHHNSSDPGSLSYQQIINNVFLAPKYDWIEKHCPFRL